MKLAIRGCGASGKKISKIIKEYYEDVQIVCFIDANPNMWGECIDGIQVVSPYYAKDSFCKGNTFSKVIIPATFGCYEIEKLIKEYSEMGMCETDIYVASVEALNYDNSGLLLNWKDVKQLPYLEFNLSDHCNLNCKGCAHFSPIAPERFLDFEKYKKDLARVREIVSHFDDIRPLGGEPLLHSQLCDFIKYTRQLYPYSRIRLATNGLKLKNLSEETINVLKENDVIVDITVYPPLYHQIDDIIRFLKGRGIFYNVFSVENEMFSSSLKLNSEDDINEKRRTCPQRCINLRDGEMTACHLLAYVDIFNKKYNVDFPTSGKINIYDDTLNIDILRKRLKSAFALCKYCDFSKEFKWERVSTEAKMEDWFA